MSIFSRIKDAIFGKAAAAQPSGGSAPSNTRATTPAAPKSPTAQQTQASPSTPTSKPAAAEPVDIDAVLTQLQSQNQQKLNWRTSIVDLMKLVGLDSSLENRKELARELGYSGDTSDSAAMNIWLHKRVMKELAANGGKVPRELLD